MSEKTKYRMRRTDIYVIGAIFFMLALVALTVIFNISTGGIFGNFLQFGIILLLFPYIIIKMSYIFYPKFKLNTKLFKWLEEEIF